MRLGLAGQETGRRVLPWAELGRGPNPKPPRMVPGDVVMYWECLDKCEMITPAIVMSGRETGLDLFVPSKGLEFNVKYGPPEMHAVGNMVSGSCWYERVVVE